MLRHISGKLFLLLCLCLSIGSPCPACFKWFFLAGVLIEAGLVKLIWFPSIYFLSGSCQGRYSDGICLPIFYPQLCFLGSCRALLASLDARPPWSVSGCCQRGQSWNIDIGRQQMVEGGGDPNYPSWLPGITPELVSWLEAIRCLRITGVVTPLPLHSHPNSRAITPIQWNFKSGLKCETGNYGLTNSVQPQNFFSIFNISSPHVERYSLQGSSV